jgi:hypothetical protein
VIPPLRLLLLLYFALTERYRPSSGAGLTEPWKGLEDAEEMEPEMENAKQSGTKGSDIDRSSGADREEDGDDDDLFDDERDDITVKM